MDLKSLFINIAILGLLIFGILAFIVTTQLDNSVDSPIIDNALINQTYADLNEKLSSSQTQMQTASGVFSNITPTQQYGELEVTSIVAPTKIARTIMIGIWNVLIKLPQVILGVSPIVASLVSSIVLILLIIGAWAIWKGAIAS